MKNTRWSKIINRKASLAFQYEVAYVYKNVLPKVINFQIKNFCYESVESGVYFVEKELFELGKVITGKIVDDDNFLERSVKECNFSGNRLVSLSKKISKNIEGNNKNDLVNYIKLFRSSYRDFLQYFVYPHSIERYLSEDIRKNLSKLIKNKNEVENYFDKLSKPVIQTPERNDFLKVALLAKSKGWARETMKELNNLKSKYQWMPLFDLTAKPLNGEYFKNSVSAIIDTTNDLEKEFQKAFLQEKKNRTDLENALNEIEADKSLMSEVKLLQEYINLRTWRKNAISQAQFYHLTLIKEVAKSLGIGESVFYLTYEEMINLLNGSKKVNNIDLKKRKTAWCVLLEEGKLSLFEGSRDISKKLKSSKIITTKQVNKKQVFGQVACKGKVRGKVKIVKDLSDLDKIQKGDIFVTHMTTPDYMVAISKVKGIVTDEGGLTCHAAIISREFEIPCIIATSNATDIFKDGDHVLLDTNKAVVKLIPKS